MLNDIQITSDYMSRWVVLKRRVGAVTSQNDTLENRIVALEKLVEKLEDRIKNGTIAQKKVCLFDGVQRHFQQYSSYIVVVSFISGGNRSTQKKPLTNFITYCCTIRPARDSYSQHQWRKALIT